jgi:hypothetical protein
MNIHLISFGDTLNYGGALTRMLVTASQWMHENTRVFSSVNIFHERHVQQNADFWSLHSEFIKNNPRGFGYWLWKSWLIEKVMQGIPDNDIVLYMDAGCQINTKAIDRFRDYCKIAQEHDICCFHLPGFLERQWTKADTAARILGTHDHDLMHTNQIIATTAFFINNQKIRNFLSEWYSLSCENNYQFLTDQVSVNDNHNDFQAHRHDQSIFSLLIKKYNMCQSLPDETYFAPDWKTLGSGHPIWATRNNTSIVI